MSWDRVPRLATAQIAERLGLTYEGPCAGGEVGAAYVRWPDGRRSVLTGGSPAGAAMVGIARAAGLPVARYELVTEIAGAPVVVQERLAGTPPEVVVGLDRLVQAELATDGRTAGLGPFFGRRRAAR